MRPLVPLHRRYLRTCRSCGDTWIVDRAIASGRLAGVADSESLTDAIDHTPQDYSGMSQAGDGLPQAESFLDALDATGTGENSGASLRAFASGMAHCARCGVEDFDQRPLKRSEKVT
jgi:hypothetical protein